MIADNYSCNQQHLPSGFMPFSLCTATKLVQCLH